MQRGHRNLTVLVMALLLLAACQPVGGQVAAPQASATTVEPADGGAPDAASEATSEAAAMDHGDMDHGDMDHGDMGDGPFDAAFIDGMIAHHEGAIAMAQQVLAESERRELLQMAEAIVAAQQGEITQMQTWRSQWYPDLAETMGMEMEMGMMEIPADESKPFDQRFLEAMIDHHQGALEMATSALEQAEHQEVRDLAQAIIAAQQAEIDQMRGWLGEWFGAQ